MQRTGTLYGGKAAAMGSAVALTLATLGSSATHADVTIADDWDLVVGGGGTQQLYDGFISYGGNNVAFEVRDGNTWGIFTVNNAYWGQFHGQSWANGAISTANFNAHTTIEFDIDLSQFRWGNLALRLGSQTSDGAGGTQEKTIGPLSLSHLLVPLPSTAGNPIVQHVSMDITGLHPLFEDPANNWMNIVPWFDIGYWGYWDPNYPNPDGTTGSWRDTGNSFTAQNVFLDNMRLTTDAVKVNAARTDNVDAAWSVGWTGGVPNGAGHTANFSPSSNAAHTITVDAPVTLGVLNFYTDSSQTVAGTNGITLTGATGVAAAINVAAGNHTIAAPLALSGNTQVAVTPAASTLTVSDLQPSTAVITKSGAGTLAVNVVRAEGLVINAGTVEVLANGGSAWTSQVKSLTVGTDAKLNLNDNDLIVDWTPTSGASPEFYLRDKAIQARDVGDAGIFFTGSDDVNSDKVLAFGEASELGVTEFNGVTVDDTAVLGKYTYYGDANFDGQVTTDDYVAVDLGLGTGDSWVQGDFDLNGSVTTDDYVVVDLNLGKGTDNPLVYAEEQAAMIALHTEMFGQSYVDKLAYASEFGWVAASVPEPGSLALLGFAGIIAGRRRIDRTRSI